MSVLGLPGPSSASSRARPAGSQRSPPPPPPRRVSFSPSPYESPVDVPSNFPSPSHRSLARSSTLRLSTTRRSQYKLAYCLLNCWSSLLVVYGGRSLSVVEGREKEEARRVGMFARRSSEDEEEEEEERKKDGRRLWFDSTASGILRREGRATTVDTTQRRENNRSVLERHPLEPPHRLIAPF